MRILGRKRGGDGLPNGWRYRLSFLLPMPMASIYGVELAGSISTESAKWWQWRDHILFHRTRKLDWPPAPVT